MAVGGVVPDLVDHARTPYVVLGAGYALLAAACSWAPACASAGCAAAVDEGGYEGVPTAWVTSLTLAGGALALATLAIIIANG